MLAAAALLLLLANWRAFTTPFFAENFQHLGPFRQLGNCLLCTLTKPTNDGWYHPVDSVLTIISFQVLGLNPLLHHLRNYFLFIADLVLLQQFLWEVIPELLPRILALALVALSKVSFTTIGYINLFGSGLLEPTLTLAAILFFVRFIKQGGNWNYVLATMAAILSIFAKETGISVLVALAALVLAFASPTDGLMRYLRRWAIYLAPVGLAVVALFVIRSFVAGSAFSTSPVYAPALSWEVFARDGIAFVAAPANLAFVEHGAMGNGGFAALLAARFGFGSTLAYSADALVLLGLGVLIGLIWRRSVSSPRLWVFPLAWMSVVFCLVITTRNLQIYYTYGFVLAFSILFAMLLVGSGRQSQRYAIGVLLVVALNGLVSNATSTYTWEFVAAEAGAATRQITALCSRPNYCDHLVLVTSDIARWQYTLGTTAPGEPMLPELLRRPNLKIDYVSPAGLVAYRDIVEPATLLVDIDHGFVRLAPSRAAPSPTGKPVIVSFGPTSARAGLPFNTQPNGKSALWFSVQGATSETVVVFAGTPLETTVSQDLGLITAIVDGQLYSHPGQYPIVLRNVAGESNTVELDIIP